MTKHTVHTLIGILIFFILLAGTLTGAALLAHRCDLPPVFGPETLECKLANYNSIITSIVGFALLFGIPALGSWLYWRLTTHRH